MTVVRGTNAFGPRQIERVIPTYPICALEGRPVPVYGEGEQRREFLYVTTGPAAALTVLDRGARRRLYNIGGGHELANLELARADRARWPARPTSLIAFVPDRPGHDFRYGVRADRLRALGWEPQMSFDDGLAETVEWYREHLRVAPRRARGPIVTDARAAAGPVA